MIFIMCLLILPLILILVTTNLYAMSIIEKQAYDSYKEMATYFISEIDNNLVNINNYLLNVASSDTDIQIMASANSVNAYALAKIRLSNKFSRDIFAYDSASYFFFYSSARDDFTITSADNSSSKTYDIADYLSRYIGNMKNGNQIQPSSWELLTINGEKFLFRMLNVDSSYIGACINIDKLILTTKMNDVGGIDMKIEGIGGATGASASEGDAKSLIVMAPSAVGNFRAVIAISNKKLFQSLPQMQMIMVLFSIVLVVLIPVSILFVRRLVLKPLKDMVSVMKQVQASDMDVRMSSSCHSEEFQIVKDTFNNMISRIQQLKINIYEEKINGQRLEIQCLRLQVNPHFFLNSLNTIYIMSRKKDNEAVQKVTLALVKYSRSIFQNDTLLISLSQEMMRVINYVEIQKIRYEDQLMLECRIPDAVCDKLVPPLVVQTFVENAIKHSTDFLTRLVITVEAAVVRDGSDAMRLHICVYDNGSGFGEDILEALRSARYTQKEDAMHIGIYNIVSRLDFIFGGNAGIRFSNRNEGGAQVDIDIPWDFDIGENLYGMM